MGLKDLLIDAQDGSFIITHSTPGEAPTPKIFKSRNLGYGDNAPLITKELPGINNLNLHEDGEKLFKYWFDGVIPSKSYKVIEYLTP